jgi:hypothetical protein
MSEIPAPAADRLSPLLDAANFGLQRIVLLVLMQLERHRFALIHSQAFASGPDHSYRLSQTTGHAPSLVDFAELFAARQRPRIDLASPGLDRQIPFVLETLGTRNGAMQQRCDDRRPRTAKLWRI